MTDYDEILAPRSETHLRPGVSVAVVTNNKDPNGWGRVKLRLPWLADDAETDWARVAAPMAGNQRGLYFLPEVGDEVLVAFEHGGAQRLYVIGCLWNGKDKPPESNADGKNDVRTIRSRSGHVVRLTDKDGAEKIEIVDKSGKNSIVLDTAKNTLTLTSGKDVTIDASSGNLTLKASSVKIEGTKDVEVKGANAKVTASAELKLKGSIVNIN